MNGYIVPNWFSYSGRIPMVFLGLLLLFEGCASSVDRCGDRFLPAVPGRERTILAEAACSKDGTFLLFRKQGQVGAVRLVAMTPPMDGGVGSGCARFEAFAAPATSDKVSISSRQTGVLSAFNLRGIHPFNWQPGRNILPVAGMRLLYFYPACLGVHEELPYLPPSNLNPKIEFAITHWRRPEEINPLDSTLVWFEPSSDRSAIVEKDEP